MDFVEKMTDIIMASLKIGAVPHSDEGYIAKLQFFKLRYTDTRIIFFQWKLWYCFLQIWNPGGLQEAFRSCILVWSFDFLSKSVEKTTNIAHLKIGAYTLFDGRYVTKPKIFSKQDRGIIFFPVKAEMFLFPNLKPRRPPEALFWFENFVFFWKFWKISKFHIKIELREASWMPPGYQIWKT